MSWAYLVLAGLFEVGWAVGLRYTDGLSRPLPILWVGISMIISLILLGMALRTIPLGTAYAVWTGIGVLGTTILGVMLFEETTDLIRVLCIVLILTGVVGLRLWSPA